MSKFCTLLLFVVFSYCSCALFFEVSKASPHCFTEELLDSGILIIRYRLFTKLNSRVDDLLIYSLIRITQDGKEVYKFSPRVPKGKTSYATKAGGSFKICFTFSGNNQPANDPLYAYLKFASDNMDDPDYQNALKEKDVNSVQSKIQNVINLSKPIILNQKNDLNIENINAEKSLSSTKWYKIMTFIQIGICIGIGLFQLNNFRKFLHSKNVI